MFDVQSYSAGQLSIRNSSALPTLQASLPPAPAILGSPPTASSPAPNAHNLCVGDSRAMAKLGEGARANTAALCVSGRRRQRWSLGGWKR